MQYHVPRRCSDASEYSPYSLSPVGSKSQKLLRSPRKVGILCCLHVDVYTLTWVFSVLFMIMYGSFPSICECMHYLILVMDGISILFLVQEG